MMNEKDEELLEEEKNESSEAISEEDKSEKEPEPIPEKDIPKPEEPSASIPVGGAMWNDGSFPPPPAPKKPKKKKKTVVLVVCLVVIYLALVGGLLALIASGTLKLDFNPETQESASTQEEQKENETRESIHQTPSTDGGSTIVGDGYTGETISAADLYENNVDCVVFVEATYRNGKATGSGFVVDSKNGYILTNYHVVQDSDDIAVTFKNSDSYTAKLVGGDEINDVAVLKVEAQGLKNVTIGNSDQIRVGEEVLIIGNPLGDLTFTLTKGIVSAVNRTINTGEYNIVTFQTDTAINSGNSGGPAFDSTGAVIGIASAKYSASGVEGIGFCIPINDAMKIANDLVNNGYVSGRPNFGITVSDSLGYEYTTDSFGRRVLVETAVGAKIEAVGKGSCAEKAGIRVGDVVTKIGDKKVQSANSLINAKNAYKAGDTVTLEIYRNGQTLTLSVTFDEYIPQ